MTWLPVAYVLRRVWLIVGIGLASALGAVPARGQPAEEALLERLCEAAGAGDVDVLLETAGERVELRWFGAGDLYSREQASYVLQEVFKEHPPARCVLHEPSKADAALFSAARLWVRSEPEPLRLYFSLRRRGDAWHLHTIRLDRPAPERDR